jgi:hypothetical protein
MWSTWHAHFLENARRPLPAAPADVREVPAAWRGPLAASLARFQIGEGGEGRIAREIDRAEIPGIDDDYRAALKLFVREEGRHARILAGLVRALGGELLRATWTERLFVRGRRLLGVRVKLLVLLVAEVVGLGFYALLAGRLGRGELAAQLRAIADDEAAHLRFHCAFFRGRAGPRTPLRAAWWLVVALACAAVMVDHRRTLRAMGIPARTAARRFAALARAVDRELAAPRAAREVGNFGHVQGDMSQET